MKPRFAVLALGAWVFATAGAEDGRWQARLTTVPIDPTTAQTVTGRGEAEAVLDGTSLVVRGNFEGLQGPATIARLHVGRGTGIRGDAVAELGVDQAASGSLSGTVELGPAEIEALRSGRVYIQIDSSAAPEGNLWGWLLP